MISTENLNKDRNVLTRVKKLKAWPERKTKQGNKP